MAHADDDPVRRATVLTLVGAAVWGTTGTAQEFAGLEAPVTVAAARVVVGAAVLAVVSHVLGRRDPSRWGPEAERVPQRGAQVLAGLLMAAYHVGFYASIDRTGVVVGTLATIGSVPVFSGLITAVVQRRMPTRRWWLATGTATFGAVLVVDPFGAEQVDVLGVLLAVAGGAAYAGFTVAGARVMSGGIQPAVMTARTFGIAAVAALPFVVADLGPLLTPAGVALVLWLGGVTVGLGSLLVGMGLRNLDAPTVGTLTLAEPAVAALLAVTLLGETLGVVPVLGAVLLLLGLVQLRRGGGRLSGMVRRRWQVPPVAGVQALVPLGSRRHH